MSAGQIFIARFSAWAPGLLNAAEWNEWAEGLREMRSSGEAPEITFTDSMFRRRLSQLSKMTIQVVHKLLPLKEDTKMIFSSFRGEISRQYQINKTQIEENALMPAAFSLSVFNAPPALASIALGLKGGYTALYPGENSFYSALDAAEAALLAGTAEELVFIYADEEIPPEYSHLISGSPKAPFAFALLLSKSHGSVLFSSVRLSPRAGLNDPAEFLKSLLLQKEIHVSY